METAYERSRSITMSHPKPPYELNEMRQYVAENFGGDVSNGRYDLGHAFMKLRWKGKADEQEVSDHSRSDTDLFDNPPKSGSPK
jgi:hypothetical protein